MTDKLYLKDSYVESFQATVLEARKTTAGWEIILDRTAFYPEGGGQPSDTGNIDGIPVTYVREENGQVLHVMPECPAAQTVTGSINWSRRFDHMQQHSGQHVLSAVFDTMFRAQTVGFHLGDESTQIDLAISELTTDQAAAVELAANAALYADLPVKAELVKRDDLDNYELRKPPTKDFAELRLVAIDTIDCCACGGTHVNSTGAIGIIKIRSWEKKNNAVRIDFVCGQRALLDYQLKNRLIQEFSHHLSAPPNQLVDVFASQLAKTDTMVKELAALRLELSRLQADRLLHAAPIINAVRLVKYMQNDAQPADASTLAKSLLAASPAIALVVAISPEKAKAHLVFACNIDGVDMGRLLKATLATVNGKGGGNPRLAQGGTTNLEGLSEALTRAEDEIRQILTQR